MSIAQRKLHLTLKPEDRKEIDKILSKGRYSVRLIKRAQVLDMLDRGYSSNEISPILGVTPEMARRRGWMYVREGLERALNDAPRPGNDKLLSERQSNQIVAMVCSKPPEGRERWTIELTAEEAVKRKIVPKVGRETIRILLKTHDLKPWREKNVVHPRQS